jgi:hypothetical protein
MIDTEDIGKYKLREEHFNMHDPVKVLVNHKETVAIGWIYSH